MWEQKNALIEGKQLLATRYCSQRHVEELDDMVFEVEPSESAFVIEGLGDTGLCFRKSSTRANLNVLDSIIKRLYPALAALVSPSSRSSV